MKLKIIADSCCDLFASSLPCEEFDFSTVPLLITVGGETIADDESLDTKSLLAKMKASSEGVKTAAPAPEAFEKEMLLADNIICITLSSKLSGTFNSARLAAEMVLAKNPNKKIEVVDSLSASSATALLILRLANLLNSNPDISFDEAVKRVIEWRDEIKIRFVLQDMSNLAKSGRMSKVAALIASVLPIKLICGDNGNGEIKLFNKAIGAKRALNVLAQCPAERQKNSLSQNNNVVITHCLNEADALIVKSLLQKNLGLENVKIIPMRGIASVYAGDKGLSLAF